ncbi:hypothetical protein FJTKL_04212 [Diaporthe vaccinii]|uniref:Uncharacterized protein n=1 Tax=Diaporthe vaccinii TaxID=105482 RepID=A0ABR4DT91_9PEZI
MHEQLSESDTIHLVFDDELSTAFFKFRLLLVPATGQESAEYAYLLISPEQIASVSTEQCTDPKIARHLRCARGTAQTTCLRFVLEKPASLVGPRDSTTFLRKVKDQARAYAHYLTTQTTLTVFVGGDAFPATLLMSLCRSASARGQLKPDNSIADIRTLYEGRGGCVVELEQTEPPSRHSEEVNNPPPYSKHCGDFSEEPQPSKKRCLDRPPVGNMSPTLHLLTRMMTVIEALERRVNRVERRMEVIEDCIERVKSEVMEEVEARIDQTSAGLRDEWDCSMDDMVTGVKVDLEDYVRNELQDAQECIVDSLQAGSWAITLERP